MMLKHSLRPELVTEEKACGCGELVYVRCKCGYDSGPWPSVRDARTAFRDHLRSGA